MPRSFFTTASAVGIALTLLMASACSLIAYAAPIPAEDFMLHTVADIPLPGRAARFDYQSYDEGRRLLFIAHLGDSSIIVFNTGTRKVVADMAGVSKVHGVFAIPALGRVYASATGRNEVVAIDETTFKVIAAIPGGEYPDGMAYVPQNCWCSICVASVSWRRGRSAILRMCWRSIQAGRCFTLPVKAA